MLIIISDAINSGKSTFCYELANNLRHSFVVGGWITMPFENSNKKIGQNIVVIRNNIFSVPKKFFSYKNGFESDAFSLGFFEASDVFFMDELGPIEVLRKGFFEIAKQEINNHKVCVAVVRSGLVEKICEALNFKADKVLSLNDAKKEVFGLIENTLVKR